MDSNIFSGLESMGLGNLKGMELYKAKESEPENKAEIKQDIPEIKETDFLLDRTQECLLCGHSFRNRVVRSGKARPVKTDMFLRTSYQAIEPLKYDIISCPDCGFTAVGKFYKPLSATQKKLVIDNISVNFKGNKEYHETYSYEEAIGRYKLALACAVVKMARPSEKAFTCLKAGWLCESYIEELTGDSDGKRKSNEDKIAEIKVLEKEFIKNAYDGFIEALKSEDPPIAGMDQYTLDYLIAGMGYKLGHIDTSARILSNLLVDRNCSSRVKDRARDLKDLIIEDLKNNK